jgi:hypothetical protein
MKGGGIWVKVIEEVSVEKFIAVHLASIALIRGANAQQKKKNKHLKVNI